MIKIKTKKIISIMLCMAIVFMLPLTTVRAADFMPYFWGDLNGDGKVTAADARIVLRASAEIIALTEQQEKAADIFGDGNITAAVARKILRVSVKLDTFLGVELENRIKQDYLKFFSDMPDYPEAYSIEKVGISYYGTFNESVVLTPVYLPMFTIAIAGCEWVAGIEFCYGYAAYPIRVWNNGSFYSLGSSYTQGLLTKSNIEQIYEIHKYKMSGGKIT